MFVLEFRSETSFCTDILNASVRKVIFHNLFFFLTIEQDTEGAFVILSAGCFFVLHCLCSHTEVFVVDSRI